MSLKTKVLTAAAFAALLASTAVQAVTYTVGTGATYRPFEYEAPNKEIVGFDIDLMKAIAKAQGFDVEFVNTTWSTIFPALNNGDRDIIMSHEASRRNVGRSTSRLLIDRKRREQAFRCRQHR